MPSRDNYDLDKEYCHAILKEGFEEEHIEHDSNLGELHHSVSNWYQSTEDYAHCLVDLAYASGYSSGAAPTSIAASAYYAAALMSNRKKSSQEVADLFKVSKTTIGKYYQGLISLQQDGILESSE